MAQKVLGFRNWKIALAVVGCLVAAVTVIVVAAAHSHCNVAISASGVTVQCLETHHD